MINERKAKRCCCEDISLIENYSDAVADATQTWHLHHRLEIQGEFTNSMELLKRCGIYYGLPASQLIYLTPFEHKSLHSRVNKRGNKNTLGYRHSEEAIRKICEAGKGNTNVRGMHWWHKGTETRRAFNSPGPGWLPGRK